MSGSPCRPAWRATRLPCTWVFHTDTDRSVPWVLARDLPAQGLLRPSGQGDVHIWPVGHGPDAEPNIALSSPQGTARLTAPLATVAQWLQRTYQSVPAGREADGLDVDGELARLLHGAA
ncbi:SsgA family sporulation/cell division regulator [Streptomyces sp. SA15]|uniref:SsgA family sporulation/cell division regulator n=1 Tax=Streptomyces sp. SA15 TaxID=934019 RepID=UPI0015CAD1CF|nr:SsgA family sporulation/cell division regulator [Streptomyces sp. SA15]